MELSQRLTRPRAFEPVAAKSLLPACHCWQRDSDPQFQTTQFLGISLTRNPRGPGETVRLWSPSKRYLKAAAKDEGESPVRFQPKVRALRAAAEKESQPLDFPRVGGINRTDPNLALAVAIGRQTVAQAEKTVAQAIALVSALLSGPRGQFSKSIAEVTTIEEALMRVPDLETIPYTVVRRRRGYEVRKVQSFTVAETVMASSSGFDFFGSSAAFSVLADYLFGKNTSKQAMDMTTPVVSSAGPSNSPSSGTTKEMTTPVISSQRTAASSPATRQGTSMEMTTPVISSREPLSASTSAPRGTAMEMTTPVVSTRASDPSSSSSSWRMAFLMPSEYGPEGPPTPVDPSVSLRTVPARLMAVVTFSGLVSDADVAARDAQLRARLADDEEFVVAPGAMAEVLQYNPPFDLPFVRRNEVAIEVILRGTQQ